MSLRRESSSVSSINYAPPATIRKGQTMHRRPKLKPSEEVRPLRGRPSGTPPGDAFGGYIWGVPFLPRSERKISLLGSPAQWPKNAPPS
jgi:hypothetical protein